MSERVLWVSPGLGESPAFAQAARVLAGRDGRTATLMGPSSVVGLNDSVDQVYRVSDPGLDTGRGDHLAAAVASAAQAFRASIVLSGPSKVDREALARAAAVLDGQVLTGVRSVQSTSQRLEVSRDLLSGNATSVEVVTSRPALLAFADEPPTPAPPDGPPPPAESVPLSVTLPHYHFRRISMRPKPAHAVDIEAADRIVSVGRGLHRKEDLALIEELAGVLGAAVGCTRPLAAESGWLSDDHWVGLTGHRVRPTLYIAIGISGAAQHLVGMRDAKVVVAINTDPNAPIFGQADFQVVGDLYAIVPALTRCFAGSARAPP